MVSVRPRGEDTGGGLVGSGGAGPASRGPLRGLRPRVRGGAARPSGPSGRSVGAGPAAGPGRPVVPARGDWGRSVSGPLCARSPACPRRCGARGRVRRTVGPRSAGSVRGGAAVSGSPRPAFSSEWTGFLLSFLNVWGAGS